MGKSLAKIALPIIGTALGGPLGIGATLGGALGGAAGGAVGGGGLKGALLGAGTSVLGSAIAPSISSSISSGLAKTGINSAIPQSFTRSVSNVLGKGAIGPMAASSLVGGALGQFAGNAIAGNIADAAFPQTPKASTQTASNTESPFSPTRDTTERPSSLSAFGNLAPEQESSNLATQGVFGGGLGPQEEKYFESLVNRRLIDESGKVADDLQGLKPIEQSYLSQLGLGGYSNARSLLEAMSKRRKNAV